MKNIWILTGVIGFFFLLGTAGSADLAHIELSALAVRLLISFAMMGGSALLYRRTQFLEAKRRRMIQKRKRTAHTHQAA
jgi:hypothetical protein